jgi:hypothetical protein
VATLKSNKKRSEELVERLNRHPEFRDKVEELLDIADNKSGDANKADDAEDLIWEELREMGQRIFQDWAQRKHDRVVGESENRKELRSMVPIVSIKTDEKGREIKDDKRKHRELSWKEARLCVARDPRSVSGHYRATMGDVEQAGLQLVGCVAEAGGGKSPSCTVWQTARRGSCRRLKSGSEIRRSFWWTSTT